MQGLMNNAMTGKSRSGLTLIEVLAATVLLGGLLASIVLAAGRLSAQTRSSAVRREAAAIADGLLAGWWRLEADEFPRSGGGDVPGKAGWRWRTSRAEVAEAEALGGEVVAVEIFPPDSAKQPAVRVEIILPPTQKEARNPNL